MYYYFFNGSIPYGFVITCHLTFHKSNDILKQSNTYADTVFKRLLI